MRPRLSNTGDFRQAPPESRHRGLDVPELAAVDQQATEDGWDDRGRHWTPDDVFAEIRRLHGAGKSLWAKLVPNRPPWRRVGCAPVA